MRNLVALIGIFCVSTLFVKAQNSTQLKVMTYNLLNFPDGRNDCSNNLQVQNRVDTLAKIINTILPDVFIANEVQTQRGANLVLTNALNVNGRTNYQMAEFGYQGSGGYVNNAVYYNADKLHLYSQHLIQTQIRPVDHIVFYGKDPMLDQLFDTTFINVFAVHLKAGSGTSEAATRGVQCRDIRAYVDTKPINQTYIIGGDMNVYRSTEEGYAALTTGGVNPFKDPINRPGKWNSSATFKDIHTQSTRNGQNIECGSTGGLDDRFDQLLVSANVLNTNNRVHYINGTYKAIGNDGNHYNVALNTGTNSMYSQALVNALYYMSDHLPVTMNLQVNYPQTNGLALQPLKQQILCNGEQTGRIEIIPHAGQAPYTYRWNHDATVISNVIDQLGVGQYCVTVTDALGETDELCVGIHQPTAMNVQTSISPVEDGCDGTVLISASGGVRPYTYTLSNGVSGNVFVYGDLCEGDYYVDVTDANNCTKRVPFTIGHYMNIDNVHAENVTVYPNPATDVITIEWTGNSNATFEIVDMLGKVQNCEVDTTEMFKTKFSVQGLTSGVYILQAKEFPWMQRVIKQ